MKTLNEQNFDSKQIQDQNFECDQRSRENIQFFNEDQNSEDESSVVFIGIVNITKKRLLKWLPILALLAAFGVIWLEDFQTYDNRVEKMSQNQQRKRLHQQKISKECYINDKWNQHVFFISFDFSDISHQQVQEFQKMNNLCHFQLKREISFYHFVNLWNYHDDKIRTDQYFINQTTLNEEQRRLLFIWLKLYYRAGIYIHASLGLNFGKYLDDEYLLKTSIQNLIIFAQYDNQKEQQGIFLPQKNFKTVKIGQRLSENVREIIKKIIVKEDWMEVCENYQCIVIKDSIKFPKEL